MNKAINKISFKVLLYIRILCQDIYLGQGTWTNDEGRKFGIKNTVEEHCTSTTRRINQNALRVVSRSPLVVKMAAARVCRTFARRMLLTQAIRSSKIVLPCNVRSRQLSSFVSRVPQFVLASSKWTQQTRSYGSSAINSVDELRDMTLNVLKLFDKVDPSKVSLFSSIMIIFSMIND